MTTAPAEEGQYVYGIIAATAECAGLSMVRTIRCGGVQALVSDVDLTDWAQDRLADADLVAERVRRHQSVLDAVSRVCTTVPMRFGIIVRGDAEVRRWLQAAQETLHIALYALEGRQEWGLKLRCEPRPEVTLTDGDDGVPEGTRYLLRKQRQRAAEREVARETARLAEWVRALFSPLADATAVLPPRDGCLINDALLVQSDVLPRLFAAENEANDLLRGRGTVELSGPWPAYTFAPALVSGAPMPTVHG